MYSINKIPRQDEHQKRKKQQAHVKDGAPKQYVLNNIYAHLIPLLSYLLFI
jgi:hypothetical protein